MLLITYRFAPAQSPGAFRTMRFVKYLPEFGWTPIVLTATPELGPPGVVNADLLVERVSQGGKSKQLREEGDSPASSKDRPDCTGGRLRTLARNAWRLLSETPDRHVRWVGPAVLRGRKLISATQADVIYTTGPPHSVHLAGSILKRLTGRAWIADLRDPWARRPWQKNENPWGERYLSRIERHCIRTADAVVLNTEPIVDDFLATYHDEPPGKFHLIPNGCDPDLMALAATLNRQHGSRSNQEFRLLHPGSCYNRRDPKPVIDAIAALSRQGVNVRFEQVGHCPAGIELTEHARQQGVADRVSIEPVVPHEQILKRMAAADGLLLIQPDAPLMVPAKFYEMLPFRKPIVALTDAGATADLIRRFDLGIVVSETGASGLANALAHLVRSREQGWSGAGRVDRVDEALRLFDGRALTERLARIFDSIAGERTGACESAEPPAGARTSDLSLANAP